MAGDKMYQVLKALETHFSGMIWIVSEIIFRPRKTVWNGHRREPVTDCLMKKDPELYELGAILTRIV